MPRRPFFFRNLGLKILALVIALLVWFALSGQRRERISERSYRIPLSLVNVPSQTMVASPLPGGVEVRVRGPFTALRQLQPERLEAVIDLLDARPGERVHRFAPEDINVPPEVEVLRSRPAKCGSCSTASASGFSRSYPPCPARPPPARRSSTSSWIPASRVSWDPRPRSKG